MGTELVMVARCDGKPVRQMSWNGKFVPWITDTEGVPIMITTQDHAETLITGKPGRYRLYRSKPFMANVLEPNGAKRWKSLPSFVYRKVSKMVTDPANGEQVPVFSLVWEESSAVAPATEEFILGKKKSADEVDKVKQLEADKERLEAVNAGLQKQLADVLQAVAGLREEVAALREKKPPRPAGK